MECKPKTQLIASPTIFKRVPLHIGIVSPTPYRFTIEFELIFSSVQDTHTGYGRA